MKPFTSRKEFNKDVIQMMVGRHRRLAKSQDAELKLKHPDWCRDANQGKYTAMDKSIKDKYEKIQEAYKVRREKLVSK